MKNGLHTAFRIRTTVQASPSRWVIGVLIALLFSGCATTVPKFDTLPPDSVSPRRPFPVEQHYDDSIVRPDHLSRDRQLELIRKTYDSWKQTYIAGVKGRNNAPIQFRVIAGKEKKDLSYSEGLGYGMTLVAYMAGHDPAAQAIFNALYEFVKNNPSTINRELMAFQVPIHIERRTSAFDGDADIAFALLLADNQWGSEGKINYRSEALKRIEALYGSAIGKTSHLPMLGDWVEPGGQKYNQFTIRSSDLMPAHFKSFAQAGGTDKWLLVSSKSQTALEAIQKDFSNRSGLVPDFIIQSPADSSLFRPATTYFLESKHDGHYFYNAARVPWRIGTDAILNGDNRSLTLLNRITQWLLDPDKTHKAGSMADGYNLSGEKLKTTGYQSKAFIGPFGIAAMIDVRGQAFVNQSFDLCVTLKQDYYEDSLGLLCMLLMTGTCWLPP